MILLPVSLGEALDKHTILELKKRYIKNNNKLKEINNELIILNEKLKEYIDIYNYQYNILLTINEEIWLDQDKFRETNDKELKLELCEKIIIDNDRRFRVKNKININSNIKEQKSYNFKKAFILHHLGMGDMITMNGAVREISTYYDVVTIVCKKRYEKSTRQMYSDDKSIQLFIIEDEQEENLLSNNHELVKTMFPDTDLYFVGVHKYKNNLILTPWKNNNNSNKFFFQNFYKDLNLDFNNRKKYEYINRNLKKEKELYNLVIKYNKNYIFVHDDASNYKIELKFIENNILVFNPNKNFYQNSHPYYELWETINHNNLNLIDYSYLIENANELHLVDSAFYCLASCLNLENVEKKCVYSREQNNKIEFHKDYDGGLFNIG